MAAHKVNPRLDITLELRGLTPVDSGAVLVALEEALEGLRVYAGAQRVTYEVTDVACTGDLFTINAEQAAEAAFEDREATEGKDTPIGS